MKFNKKIFTILLTIISIVSIYSNETPNWISSFGTDIPFEVDVLSGFGMHIYDRDEDYALELAKQQALADLSRSISVEIKSELIDGFSEVNGESNSYVSSVISSSSDLNIRNVEYLIEQINGNYYVLAYIESEIFIENMIDECKLLLLNISSNISVAEDLFEMGNLSDALEGYIQVLPLFSEFYTSYAKISSYSFDIDNQIFKDFNRLDNIVELVQLESFINSQIEYLLDSSVENFDDALNLAYIILRSQGVNGGNIQMQPFKYQNSDFSSEFGQYATNRIVTLLENGTESDNINKIIQGTYWVTENNIELMIQVKRIDDNKIIGSATVQFFSDSLSEKYDIRPVNHEQALLDLMEFQDSGLTDSSIFVEVWTNNGRNEDVLVYNAGQQLELYFRVNQPSTLQITYVLATGEKVLLLDEFYIGLDKVNKVVKFPFSFDVVPPFGVERMIVTAYSSAPPRPNVYPAIIDGEQYMVFGSVTDVLSQARGLRLSTETEEIRTGEAQLAITTIP